MKIILFFATLLTGCSALDGYTRRYSIGYEDDHGRRIDVGVELIPIETKK